ncbi:MAG: polysaccharide pyruvyl transferase family protein [Bacteroidales bacterium]
MKRVLNRFNHSNTLIEYLIFGIVVRLVYCFERRTLRKQVDLFNIDFNRDDFTQSQVVQIPIVEYLKKVINENVNKAGFSLFTINLSNYSYSDDFNIQYNEIHKTGSLFFIPGLDISELLDYNENTDPGITYDIKLFLASQASAKNNCLSKRLYYARLLRKFNERNIKKSSFHSDPIKEFLQLYLPSFSEALSLTKSAILGRMSQLNTIKANGPLQLNKDVSNPVGVTPDSWRNVIITGWYGTETNGDKAILGELVHFIKTCSPHCEITITSICPMVSYQTNLELGGLSNAKIVELEKSARPSLIEKTDCVIIGGGPLMESSALSHILSLLIEANKQKKARVIFGCGIGPIHTEKSRTIIAKILELTSVGFLRDEESFNYANKLYPEHNLKWACDPAFGYIYRWRKCREVSLRMNSQLRIAGLLRANTREFNKDINHNGLLRANDKASFQIAAIIEPACNSLNATCDLLHMNAPWIGGDDRLFNRKVEGSFSDGSHVNCARRYLTLEEHLRRLCSADVSIAMRYHGHIFSMALGIPFLSINYTGEGGKVGSLINRINYNKWSVSWTDLDVEKTSNLLQNLFEERQNISFVLLEKTNTLIEHLYNTYRDVFGIKIDRLI